MSVCNGIIYTAGQVAPDATQDIRGQTTQVLAAVDALLARANSDRREILMAQIFISDLSDLDGMNEVWDEWVEPGHAPPRATVQAQLVDPQWKIEIVVIASVRGC